MSSILIQDVEGIYREAMPILDAVCSPVRSDLCYATPLALRI